MTPAPETISSTERGCELKAERSEILEDSGASGAGSGVSERKPERNDERVVSLLIDVEGCEGDDELDGGSAGSGAVLFRAGRIEGWSDDGE